MRFVLAALAGAAYPLGFAPFEIWPLTVASVVALFWLLQKAERSHAWIIWWFAAGKYAVGASWIYVSINVYGGAPPPLAVFLVVLFVIILAFFHWPAGWIYDRLRSAVERNVLVLAVLLVGTEWLLTWFLTGFPWLFIGHALLDSPLGGALPVVGTLGTSLLAALSAGCLFLAAYRKAWLWGMVALLPWLGGWVLGLVTWTEERGTYEVALVQGNLDQATKWLPEERGRNVQKHLALTREHWGVDLVIWPEAAITLVGGGALQVLEHIDELADESGSNVVVGVPSVERFPDGSFEFKNDARAAGLASGRFSKHHLVPFGEFVPFEGVLRGLIAFFDLPMSSTTPGVRSQPNMQLLLGANTVEAAMAICYEVAYAESLRRHASTAGVLMTISNDTWFGASIGPLQHMQISRVRARENGRWMLRATNNGVTGIVAADGRLVEVLPQFDAGVLRSEFTVTTGRTPYNRVGDWPVLLLLIGVLGTAFWRVRKSR